MRLDEHQHPLHLVDLQPNFPHCEEIYDDEEEKEEEGGRHQDFRSRECDRCRKEINWFHRYYYECDHDSCNYSLHKFCGDLPVTLKKHTSHPHHTLFLYNFMYYMWKCTLCGKKNEPGLGYDCSTCFFEIHANCAMLSVDEVIIYHPSHQHPLAVILEPLLSKCYACGKKHQGIFYVCTMCYRFLINSDCAFLSKQLIIQDTTNDNFSHTHPLTISYSFPRADQNDKFDPRCRVCNDFFSDENLWIYKCDKCRYYTHLDCATSREEPFMSIISSYGNRKLIKNFKDSDYPDLLHLPFRGESDGILKHLFFKQVGCETSRKEDGKLKYNFHQHPLILVHTECKDVTCHNPMKKIELLCNCCVRPITSVPFYKCINDDLKCNNFVLHEWCTRLPAQVETYPDHPQHTLILHPNARVFICDVCSLSCNGFVYSCDQCDYHIDVKCGFIPENITHEAHPGHILSRVQRKWYKKSCRLCARFNYGDPFSFLCHTCNVFVHANCAMLLPREITHKYDKHPMSLSYFPIENHKSEYFCEVCEERFDPERCFYHCHQCAYSIHSTCAPVFLQSERANYSYNYRGIYPFVNIKFGSIYKVKGHPHPLAFTQGIESDGKCSNCCSTLQYNLIFKCQQCKFAIDLKCFKSLSYDMLDPDLNDVI